MAESTTTRLALPRWTAGGDTLNRVELDTAMANLEDRAAIDVQGTLAARPAPGVRGRYYFADDEPPAGVLYRDTGTAWHRVAAIDTTTLGALVRHQLPHNTKAETDPPSSYPLGRTTVLAGSGSSPSWGTALGFAVSAIITTERGGGDLAFTEQRLFDINGGRTFVRTGTAADGWTTFREVSYDVSGALVIAPHRKSNPLTVIANTTTNSALWNIDNIGPTAGTDHYKYELAGDILNNTGATQNITFRVYLGNTIVLGPSTVAVATSASRRRWRMVVDVACDGAGNKNLSAEFTASDPGGAFVGRDETLSLVGNNSTTDAGARLAAYVVLGVASTAFDIRTTQGTLTRAVAP